ncbi:transcription antiterminator NusG [Mesorhizobium sp. M1338]|uniref:transcription termination/antitermination protein NusG n=1 Tax=unclassified Mesorhizobium TaxID=325217 RepID=UPI00333D1F8A
MLTSHQLSYESIEVRNTEGQAARWYAVHTQPHAEENALRHLERQGFRAFLPRRIRTIRHARRVTVAKEAYFPSYLFIALRLERDRWRCINSTVGVEQVLSACDRPLPFRIGLVEALMAATGPDGILRPREILRPGQTVRVSDGAFAEQIGILDSVQSSGAIQILLTMMERKVSVQLSRELIRVIS